LPCASSFTVRSLKFASRIRVLNGIDLPSFIHILCTIALMKWAIPRIDMMHFIAKSIYSLAVILLLTACKSDKAYTPPNLSKLSQEEMLTLFKNQDFPDAQKVVFRNEQGIEIPLDSIRKMTNPHDYAQDFYQNKEGAIQVIVWRPASEADKLFQKKLEQAVQEGPEVKKVEVNCDDKVNLLQTIFDRDQAMRQPSARYDPKVDHENLETIISFLEKCGMPTLAEVDELQMAAIWAVLQHGPAKYQSEYLPMVEEAAKNGDIKWSVVALMKDRALMHEGKPQVYGSQISNGALYDLIEPEYVNQRREEMGMGPLEEYLERFGIAFDVEQRQK